MVRIEWSAGQLLLSGGVAMLAALAWPARRTLELMVRAGLVCALSACWTVIELWGLVGGQLREMLGDRADAGWLAPVAARIIIDSGGLIPAGLVIAAMANALLKTGITVTLGSASMRGPVLLVLGATALCAGLAAWLI
jgi:hypothetical protein